MKHETEPIPQDDGSRKDWIDRAHDFAVRILKMSDHLPRTAAGKGMASQIVRSGPSIVHNLEEAKGANTLRDTLHKTVIARKEAREVRRSLLLIRDADLLPEAKLVWLLEESNQLVSMLTAGTKRLQAKIDNQRKTKPR